jgi:NADPH2:quinone reductase
MMPATFPLILGSDLAGVVEAVGEGASRFSKGDEVFGQLFIAPLGSTGTYAEYVAVAEDASRPRAEGARPGGRSGPANLRRHRARDRRVARAARREDLLMIGAAGGIGSFATQLAAKAGAHVIAVARADDRLRGYGAAETIDYTAVSVPDAVRRTHPDGIDVLVDVASDAEGFPALAPLVRRAARHSTREMSPTPKRSPHGKSPA